MDGLAISVKGSVSLPSSIQICHTPFLPSCQKNQGVLSDTTTSGNTASPCPSVSLVATDHSAPKFRLLDIYKSK